MPAWMKTVAGSARPALRRSRIASRARSSVATGPSVRPAFGSASVPDQASLPLGETCHSAARPTPLRTAATVAASIKTATLLPAKIGSCTRMDGSFAEKAEEEQTRGRSPFRKELRPLFIPLSQNRLPWLHSLTPLRCPLSILRGLRSSISRGHIHGVETS